MIARTAGLIAALALLTQSAVGEEPYQDLLGTLKKFEGKFDPKCYATAARLEDFMFGTPLSDEARFLKNKMIMHFVESVWRAAPAADSGAVSKESIARAIAAAVKISALENGDHKLLFEGGAQSVISARDLRQYGSVAYSYRAILAKQQANLLSENPLPALGADALEELKAGADLVGLALLQKADERAKDGGEREISAAGIMTAWEQLLGKLLEKEVDRPARKPQEGQPLLKGIIKQKRESYAAYNQIANQLFVRNLQVYFARLSWPKDPAEARAFRQAFTESVIAFAADLYRDAARLSAEGKKGLENEEQSVRLPTSIIGEREVALAGQRFLPHEVNEYEDVIFFPLLAPSGRTTIEAYDFDAFRDSGIHWFYLSNALDDLADEKLPDADPFAAELLAENVAQFGVFLLRIAGEEGIKREEERLSVKLLEHAMRRIQNSITAHVAKAKNPDPATPENIDSAAKSPLISAGGGATFREVGSESGVVFMHRSSDWLSRLLRSYLQSGKQTGTITIPPAFGGAGVAAEDVNGDGHIDLLMLSGLGNRLYLGAGDGKFSDTTANSGLSFRRESDRLPGEPRQPLIADFDNDGHQDIFISYVDDEHRLYRGKGDGTFQDVTAVAKLGGKGLVGGPATTFDFDGDGLLDIYISYFGNYVGGVLPTLQRRNDSASPNRLFRNLGGMRFADVTEKAGVGDTGWGQSAIHCDFDGDAKEDLISGNDFGVNRYYRNRGDGTFEEISSKIGTDKPSYTMSLSTADLNGDLIPDIYVSNIVTMNKDEKYVLPNADTRMKFNLEKLAHLRVVGANDLFLSQKTDAPMPAYNLSRRAVGRGHALTGWAWDADFFDADLDGDDDLYVLNGMNEFNIYSSRSPYFMDPDDPSVKDAFVPISPKEANVFLENDGGKLETPTKPSGLEFLGNSRSAVFLDWDSDGDLDVVTNNFGEAARLFENGSAGEGSKWIKLKLVGEPKSGVNRDAIGAKVIFRFADGRTIWREVLGSTGYQSVHPKQVHAGLGRAATVAVEIIWPDGKRQKIASLVSGKIHRIAYPVEARDVE